MTAPHRRQPASKAVAKQEGDGLRKGLAALGLGALIALGAAVAAKADGHEKIIESHGISTFGELKYDADFPHLDYINPDAFSTWAFGTFDSLTPYILKGNAGTLASVFYDSLLTSNLDEPDSYYGLLAERIEYPESREWVIFHMRPEARFRDGTQGEQILTAGSLPIFSKDYYADRDFAEPSLEPPMGSGAYDLLSVKPGSTVSYKRRDDYWAKDLPVNVGQNNFDEIHVEYFADYTTAFEAFKAGEYLYREEFSSQLWATGYDFPAIDKGHVVIDNLPDGRPAGTQGFWFNMRRDKFKDPRVRQALGMAFNFEWSNESLFYGIYDRTDSFWENSRTLQASGMPSEAELALLEPLRDLVPASVFEEPAFVPATSKASELADRRVLRRAGKLLDEAGWEVGDDGMRRKDGVLLEVEFLNDSPTFDRIINPYVENLKRLGVQAVANRVDAAEAQEREKRFDYDVITQRFSMSSTPGDELRSIFGSETANVEGSVNVGGLENEAVDSLIRTIADATSREELTVAVQALDRVLRSLHLWVPQWYKGVHNLSYRDVFGRPYTDNPPPFGKGELSLWWWDEEKAAVLRAAGAL